MQGLRELDRVTAALAEAVERQDLAAAEEALHARRVLLARTDLGGDPAPALEGGRRALESLSRGRAGLRDQIARLKQTREMLSSYRPARKGRRRVDLSL